MISDSSIAPADVVGADDVDVDDAGATADFASADVQRDTNGDPIDQEVTGTGFGIKGTTAGNYTLLMDNTDDAKITPKNVDGSFTADDKTYDGNDNAAISASSIDATDVVGTEDVTLDDSGASADFASANVARDLSDVVIDQVVTSQGFELAGADIDNYALVMATDDAKINPKDVDGSFLADDKPYDGNDDAVIGSSSLEVADIVGADDVTLDDTGATADFASANVARNLDGDVIDQTVTASGFDLDGTTAGNYSLVMDDTDEAKITPKSIDGSFTADDKTYDGDDNAVIDTSSIDATDIVGTEDVTLDDSSAGADFASVDVARDGGGVVIDQVVTSHDFALDGADSDNYSLAMATDNAMINPKDLDGTFTAADKTYDGNDDATITDGIPDAADVVGTDDVDVATGAATADFATAEVARDVGDVVIDQVVTGSGFSLSGAKAGNYTLVMDTTDDAKINPKNVDGSFTADDKTYDQSDDANISASSLDAADVVGADDVDLDDGSATADFASANVARNGSGVVIDQVVTGSNFDLSGTKAGNYTLVMDNTDDAKINPKGVNGTFTADNKVYNGTTAATVTHEHARSGGRRHPQRRHGRPRTTPRRADSSRARMSATASTVTGYWLHSLDRADRGNYTLTTGAITDREHHAEKDLTGAVQRRQQAVYDGTQRGDRCVAAHAAWRHRRRRLIASERPLRLVQQQEPRQRQAGHRAIALTGGDAGNYAVDPRALPRRTSRRSHVTGSFNAASKTYNGTRTAWP